MKKLLLFTLIFLTGTAIAQNQIAYTTITSVTDTVYTGDSLKINFTFAIKSSPSSDMVQIVIHNGFYSQNCLWSAISSMSSLYGVKNDINGTKYLMVKITPAMGTGYTRIIANQNEKPTFIKTPIVQGIEENFKNYKGERQYFDLTGNRIDVRYNELIIEQIGNYRRKVFIQP